MCGWVWSLGKEQTSGCHVNVHVKVQLCQPVWGWVGRDTGRMNSVLQTVSFEFLQPISHSKLPLLILVREVTFNPLKWRELHALSIA